MRRKKTRESSNELIPLVGCATCGAVVESENAQVRWVNVHGVPEKVWICNACIRLGRGAQVQKYIMRERKVGR